MNISNPANTAVLQTEHATMLGYLSGSILVIGVTASNDLLLEENTVRDQATALITVKKVWTNLHLTGVARIRVEVKNPTGGKYVYTRIYDNLGTLVATDDTLSAGYVWVAFDITTVPGRTYLICISTSVASTASIQGTQICGVATGPGGTLIVGQT